MGLLDDKTRGVFKPKSQPEKQKIKAQWVGGSLLSDGKEVMKAPSLLDSAGLINQFMPVTGDIQSGLLAINDARKGNYGSAALNSLGVLPFIPSLAGTFIGKGAKTWDEAMAQKALEMANNGIDERKIWEETGTFRGADGHWRQEISDHEMSHVIPINKWSNRVDGEFKAPNVSAAWDEAASTLTPQAPVRVKRLFSHDELKKSYPYGFTKNVDNQSILDIPVMMDEASHGSYGDGILGLNPNLLPKEAKSTTLHELQHVIQNNEGWSKGGSLDSAFMSMRGEDFKNLQESLMPEVKKLGLDDDSAKMTAWQRARMQAYKNLAGEAEARATQARLNMTPEQRRKVFPFDSYDVPRESLIVRGLLK